MARVCNEFSSYKLFAGGDHVAARLYAGLAEAFTGRLARLLLTSTIDLRDNEYRLSRQSTSQRLPGGVFDARYDGLAPHAARVDAAICRRERLR
jgi:hypothetical protein